MVVVGGRGWGWYHVVNVNQHIAVHQKNNKTFALKYYSFILFFFVFLYFLSSRTRLYTCSLSLSVSLSVPLSLTHTHAHTQTHTHTRTYTDSFNRCKRRAAVCNCTANAVLRKGCW